MKVIGKSSNKLKYYKISCDSLKMIEAYWNVLESAGI
jgi:hypothetical protein